MPKLYSSARIIKVLEEQGFFFVSQRGSHLKYRKKGRKVLTVIVPANRRVVPIGTFKSILRQSQLGDEDFGERG